MYEKRTEKLFWIRSRKGSENRSSRFVHKISLIPFSRCWSTLEVGLGISWTTPDSQWNPVYKIFHRISKYFSSKQTNWLVAFQTWSICWKRAANARELKQTKSASISFFYAIYHVFWISKYGGESDLGLCTTSGLAKRMRMWGGNFWLKYAFGRKICRKSPPRSRIIFASPEVVQRPK